MAVDVRQCLLEAAGAAKMWHSPTGSHSLETHLWHLDT